MFSLTYFCGTILVCHNWIHITVQIFDVFFWVKLILLLVFIWIFWIWGTLLISPISSLFLHHSSDIIFHILSLFFLIFFFSTLLFVWLNLIWIILFLITWIMPTNLQTHFISLGFYGKLFKKLLFFMRVVIFISRNYRNYFIPFLKLFHFYEF